MDNKKQNTLESITYVLSNIKRSTDRYVGKFEKMTKPKKTKAQN